MRKSVLLGCAGDIDDSFEPVFLDIRSSSITPACFEMSFRIPRLDEESEETFQFETLEQALLNGERAFSRTKSAQNINSPYQPSYMVEDAQIEVDSSR